MSRQSMMPSSRNLTLMEELERLEQSITLTLQEIDHNFSRAHRIVTTSIIPVVEQYAQHSNAVWQGSEFWKGFFEASANVKLSSYEEPVEGSETLEEDETLTAQGYGHDTPSTRADHDNDDTTNSTATTSTPRDRPTARHRHVKHPNSSSPTSSSPATYGTPPAQTSSGGTSRASNLAGTLAEEASFADYPSPYETLKQEITSTNHTKPSTTMHRTNASAGPITPGIPKLAPSTRNVRQGQIEAPDSSPFLAPPTTTFVPLQNPATTGPKNTDPLLHRVLDKNYRIQATPLTTRRANLPPTGVNTTTQGATPAKPTSAGHATQNPVLLDFSSPFSPPVAAPQLRSEIFGSPVRASVPRTPGVSVQKGGRSGIPSGYRQALTGRGRTPRAGGDDTANIFGGGGGHIAQESKSRQQQGQQIHRQPTLQVWDSGSEEANIFNDDYDEDMPGNTLEELGISPPKTLQFHIPASRLLQTPAREASRRIVEDLMLTAGMAVGEEGGEGEEGGVVSRSEKNTSGMRGNEKGMYVDDDDEIIDDEDEDYGGGRGGVGDDDSPSVVRVMRRDADADAF